MADPTAFQPYYDPLYQAPQPWANANTYAPWATPNGQNGSNPSFTGQGAQHSIGTDWTGVGNSFDWMNGGGSWLGLGKKRSSPNFYAPSYQGSLFTPQEGLPQWYQTSAEGSSSDQALQAMLNPGSNNATTSTNSGANVQNSSTPNFQNSGASGIQSYGFDTMPSYIGQAPYLGNTVNNYSPAVGANYGGYDSYGGYGNSNSSTKSNYQPFVPTGLGQY